MRKAYFVLGLTLLFAGIIILASSYQNITSFVIVENANATNVRFAGISLIFAGLVSLLISKRKAKGQAAIEFLMTYGWAIMAAIIVLGVLSFFGVFNPDSFSVGSVALSPPFYVNAWHVSQSEIVLEVRNSGPGANLVSGASVTFKGHTCSTVTSVNIPQDSKQVITIPCPELASETRISGDIEIKYTKETSNLVQSAYGTIQEKVYPSTTTLSTYSLTVNVAGSGTVTCDGVPCGDVYEVTEQVTLAAIPDSGYEFAGWSVGNCQGTGECVLSMTEDMTIDVTFNAIQAQPQGGESPPPPSPDFG